MHFLKYAKGLENVAFTIVSPVSNTLTILKVWFVTHRVYSDVPLI